jgi:hypothetical protein
MRFTFNPLASFFLNPTTKQILQKQLREAEASRAEHSTNREYHSAMERMLGTRISRIRNELKRMA